MDSILTQIMTGHGGFSEYLHHFRCKERSSRPCDNEKTENKVQLIVECPMYESTRNYLEMYMGISIIIQDKSNRDKFLDYCRKIVSETLIRNK